MATRISYLTDTTRKYYRNLSDGTNYCLNPGWIDLEKIDRYQATHNRASCRARLNINSAQKLVINVGSICERKGQHMFARAVDLLWKKFPDLAATFQFLMIGGRDTAFDRDLAAFITTLNHPNLRIVPATDDVYPYFGATDLFVCSSYEESFPRVVLEAMAFSLPIISTAVHGIPEIVRAGEEAILVPPGDTVALATAMKDLATHQELSQTLAQAARTRVAAEFDSRVVLPKHIALASSLRIQQP